MGRRVERKELEAEVWTEERKMEREKEWHANQWIQSEKERYGSREKRKEIEESKRWNRGERNLVIEKVKEGVMEKKKGSKGWIKRVEERGHAMRAG